MLSSIRCPQRTADEYLCVASHSGAECGLYCIRTSPHVNTFFAEKQAKMLVFPLNYQNILYCQAADGPLLEGGAIDALDDGPVVGPMQMVDIIIDDHTGGISPRRFHTHIGFLLL